MEQKKKEKALLIYNEAIESGKDADMAEAYYMLSKYEAGLGNYYICKNWLQKALLIYKKGKYNYEYGRIYQRLCEAESFLYNYAISKKYADSAIVVFKGCNSIKGLISTYQTLLTSTPLFDLQDSIKNKSAQEKFQIKFKKADELINLAKKNDLEVELGYLYNLKGLILEEFQPKKALEAFIQAKRHFLKLGQEPALETTGMYMAFSYAKIGETKKAWELINSRPMYKKDSLIFSAYSTKRQMAIVETYKAEKNWKKAFEALNQLKLMKEANSTGNQERYAKYYNSLTDHDLAAINHNKDYEMKLQAENLKTNSQLKNLAFLFIIILFGFLAYMYWQYRKMKKMSTKNYTLSQKNELLLKEQNHRILNNLQVISSIIGLQKLKQTDDVFVESMDDLKNRVEVLSRLQEKFNGINADMSFSVKDFLEDIIKKLDELFAQKVIYHIDIEPIKIKADAALHLGIIVNELVTNSYKYAFGTVEKPEITLNAKIQHNQFEMNYADNGNGEIRNLDKNRVGSFGQKLIDLKVQELGGKHTINFEKGFSFTFQTNITNVLA